MFSNLDNKFDNKLKRAIGKLDRNMDWCTIWLFMLKMFISGRNLHKAQDEPNEVMGVVDLQVALLLTHSDSIQTHAAFIKGTAVIRGANK
ncbi:hypothetical protein GK047_05640 [Paenibacillus sp. SYP-B3998]|uniref:Uncharacterized protein n=1 Tax=Paenibacillus sp. SYP-B3998 TaxID=2678564 RepID=A0A6G3ZV81_9BACL|nr:hypothetical protein [Paenibacillus sp. SYP-B3998]NEW05499.1 hypothetical protein [Paenibacillus sp. SYP-B3998]